MIPRLSRKEKTVLASLTVLALISAFLARYYIQRTPPVRFGWGTKPLFWKLFFLLLGVQPAAIKLSANPTPTIASIGLLIGGCFAAILSYLSGSDPFSGGLNIVLMLVIAIGTWISLQYGRNTKRWTLLGSMALVALIVLYAEAYLGIAMMQIQRLGLLIPILVTLVFGGAIMQAYWKEYQGMGDVLEA